MNNRLEIGSTLVIVQRVESFSITALSTAADGQHITKGAQANADYKRSWFVGTTDAFSGYPDAAQTPGGGIGLAALLVFLGACTTTTDAAILANRSADASLGGSIVGWAGKCVDDNGGATSDGTNVQLWACNDSDAQKWAYTNGTFVGPGGKCLDVQSGNQVSGTPVQLWTCNGTAAQKWSLQGKQLVSAGGLCLDVNAWGTSDGTQLQLWKCTGGANQQWTVGRGASHNSAAAAPTTGVALPLGRGRR